MPRTKTAKHIIRMSTDETPRELQFNIVEELFVISEHSNGDTLRLDYASWGSGDPKYELRLWHKKKDGTITRKGVGLTGEELLMLRDALNEMEAE